MKGDTHILYRNGKPIRARVDVEGKFSETGRVFADIENGKPRNWMAYGGPDFPVAQAEREFAERCIARILGVKP